MAVRFQLRRDTAANWTASNPTLALGEPGVETDTLKVKVGDGSTAWNSLAYSITKDFTDLTSKPTTIAGYGITDALTLTALSVTQNAASGTGTLSYNNTTGVFEYTPPDFAGLTGNFTGSVFADDSTIMVDGVSATLNFVNNSITDLPDADQTVRTTDDVEFNKVTTSTIDSSDSSAITVETDVVLNAGLTVGNHIIPSSNENIDLGSDSFRFRDLYLSGSSAIIGDLALKRHVSGGLLVSDHSTGDPTNITTHNITANDITAAGTITGDVTGNLTGNVTGDVTGTVTGNIFTSLIDSSDSSAITFTPSVVMNSDLTVDNQLTVNNVRTTGSVQIDGDLTVSGTTVTIDATNLAVEDNMVYLNSTSAVANPDLGFAGNYNDGTYAHAGLFRDATDGNWKFYDSYTPEPDASAYIDTSHASFGFAPLTVSRLGIGDVPDSTAELTILDSADGGSSWNSTIQLGRRAGTSDLAYIQTHHDGSDGVDGLNFKFNTTDVLTILDGKVGIGKIDPTRNFVVSGAGGVLVSIVSTDDDNCQLMFGDSASDTIGKVIYRHADDRLTLQAGNTETVHVVGGKVGIGYNDPADNIHVLGTSGVPSVGITLQSHDTANATAAISLYARDASNVNKISEIKNVAGQLFIERSDAGTDVLALKSTAAGAGGPQLDFYHHSASPADNDVVGTINFNGWDDGSNGTTYARISGIAADVTNGAEKGDFIISNRTDASTFSEKVRVKYDGNVGIGIDGPTAKLHVHATSTSEPLALFQTTTGGDASIRVEAVGGESYIELANTSGATGSSANSWGIGLNDNLDLYFGYGPNGSLNKTNGSVGTQSALLISEAGAVGINDNAPGVSKSSGGTTYANVFSVDATGYTNCAYFKYNASGAMVTLNNTIVSGTRYFLTMDNGSTRAGDITYNGSVMSYGGTSDYRLKDNVTSLSGGIDRVKSLNPVSFTWKHSGDTSEGFIAHEVQEIVPAAVMGEKDAVNSEGNPVYQQVDPRHLVATLTSALKEAIDKIESLEQRLNDAGL